MACGCAESRAKRRPPARPRRIPTRRIPTRRAPTRRIPTRHISTHRIPTHHAHTRCIPTCLADKTRPAKTSRQDTPGPSLASTTLVMGPSLAVKNTDVPYHLPGPSRPASRRPGKLLLTAGLRHGPASRPASWRHRNCFHGCGGRPASRLAGPCVTAGVPVPRKTASHGRGGRPASRLAGPASRLASWPRERRVRQFQK